MWQILTAKQNGIFKKVTFKDKVRLFFYYLLPTVLRFFIYLKIKSNQ